MNANIFVKKYIPTTSFSSKKKDIKMYNIKNINNYFIVLFYDDEKDEIKRKNLINKYIKNVRSLKSWHQIKTQTIVTQYI